MQSSLLMKNIEYRKIGLISIPLFYILIVVSATLFFDIPIEKMLNVYTGNYDSIIGVYLHLSEYDLLSIAIILLGIPLIYSNTLYTWVVNSQWGRNVDSNHPVRD